MTLVYEMPGMLRIEWDEECKAMFNTWISFRISSALFREALLEKGLPFAMTHGAQAWVMDATGVTTAVEQDIQALAPEIFKAYAAIGIKYYLRIKAINSPISNLSIERYSGNLRAYGIQLLEVSNQAEARLWLKLHPSSRQGPHAR